METQVNPIKVAHIQAIDDCRAYSCPAGFSFDTGGLAASLFFTCSGETPAQALRRIIGNSWRLIEIDLCDDKPIRYGLPIEHMPTLLIHEAAIEANPYAVETLRKLLGSKTLDILVGVVIESRPSMEAAIALILLESIKQECYSANWNRL